MSKPKLDDVLESSTSSWTIKSQLPTITHPFPLPQSPTPKINSNTLPQLTFDGNILLLRALTIMSDVGYADEVFSQVITALSDGRLNNEALRSCITARVPLEDTQEGGLRELVDNKAKHMKILIKISGEK